MSITFQKRQKELKRKEKQRAKAERREQRKAAKRIEELQRTPTTPSSNSPQLFENADTQFLCLPMRPVAPSYQFDDCRPRRFANCKLSQPVSGFSFFRLG